MRESVQIPRGRGWVVGVMVFVSAILILLMLFVGFGLIERSEPSGTVVPQTGAALVPTATARAVTPSASDRSPKIDILIPGRRVAAISPDGAGTRVYGDSNIQAMILDIYQDGAAFEIMEPGSDVPDYPVQEDGRTWYRVRATDGLVGWVIVDRLVPLE